MYKTNHPFLYKANGIDLTGYMHNIDTSAIRHIFNNHGDVKAEDKRGQIAITDEDIKTLPNYIINNYDYIAFGLKNDKGLDVIAYAKNMPDGSSVYMEEVRTGKKTLTTDTLYKRKTGITSDIFRGILQSPIVQSTHTDTNIIGQNNDGVNNLESDAIETGNENIDTSFEPAEFDEEYAKAMEEQQRLLIEEMKESGAIPTIKSEKQRLKDMGIGKILRPKKDDPMYSEYKHLSPRIQREFFYDEKDSIINNSKGYTWDNAEHDLQQATNNDKASIWEELEDIDRNVSKYENLGLASGGEKNRKYDVNLIYDKNGKPVKIEFNDKLIDKNNVHPIELKEKKFDGTKRGIVDTVFGNSNKEKRYLNNSSIEKKYFLSNRALMKIYSTAMTNNTDREVSLKILTDIKNIFNKAEYILKHRDLDGVDRNIERFANIVRTSDGDYFVLFTAKNGEIKAVEYNNLYDMKVINKKQVLNTSGSPREVLAPMYRVADLKNFVNRYLDKYRKNKPEVKNNNNGNAAYSSVLKTGVKVGAEEKPKESDFKLYQRVYDLAKKYMKNIITILILFTK